MASSSSSSSETPSHPHIPKTYQVLEVLGEGGYGTVVRCINWSTGQVVAVKIPKVQNLQQEAFMMSFLMSRNLEKFNIVKYYGELLIQEQKCLVYESLDISLYDYLVNLNGPMRLEDIRTIIQGMATAFDALKGTGVIHADVKPDNIMLVDRIGQPFRVKLIDFGLAIFQSKAKQGRVLQTPYFRAPEVMLGLPFSEAIDIWSLGCVMAIMVFGFMLFPARLNYNQLRYMTDLLGPPPQHLINAGLKSKLYFRKTDTAQWILMSCEEYWGETNSSMDDRFYQFRSLDEPKTMRLEVDNDREPDERRECMELLKAMLHWEGEKRITPAGILNHPFITRSYLSSSAPLSSCDEPGPCSSSRTEKMAQADDSTSQVLPSRIIMVQQAPPKNRIHLEETPDELKMKDQMKRDQIKKDQMKRDQKKDQMVPPGTMKRDQIKKDQKKDQMERDQKKDQKKDQMERDQKKDQMERDQKKDQMKRDQKKDQKKDQMERDQKKDQIRKDQKDQMKRDQKKDQMKKDKKKDHMKRDQKKDQMKKDKKKDHMKRDQIKDEKKDHMKRDQMKDHQKKVDQIEEGRKKKKRKNCFKRFCSLLRRTFGSCCCVDNVLD